MTELETITQLISQVGKIPAVAPDADIFDAGFVSINALELLVELETQFDVSIPDDDFLKARTPRDLMEMVSRLKNQGSLA